LLNLFVALIIVTIIGYGPTVITGRFRNQNKIIPFLIIPASGYVIINVIFLQLYTFTSDAFLSIKLCIISLMFFSLIVLFIEIKKFGYKGSLLFSSLKNIDYKLFLIGIIVLLIGSWQYFLVGEGNYYHSGNEDYFDAINGGLPFLNGTPVNLIFFDFSSHIRFHAIIKFQYSSQAMWRALFNINGMDGFLLQALLNLLLTILGIYWISETVFRVKKKIALYVSFWSIASSFYFVTYMTGHVGSLMYVSVIPVIVGLFLLWSRKELNWPWLGIIILFYYFIDNTYPGPIYYLAIPALLILFNDRVVNGFNLWNKIFKYFSISYSEENNFNLRQVNKKRIFILTFIVILISTVALFWLWSLTEPWRLSALLRTNVSWKITLYKEMFMVFWGIFPPGSTGTMSVLPLFIADETINVLSFIVSLSISCFVLIAIFQITFRKDRAFLFIYGLLFIIYLIVMRYFWGSSYYLYKFLYVHQFLLITILLLWLFERVQLWRSSVRKLIYSLFIIVGFLNIFWTILLTIDFYNRPYHNSDAIRAFLSSISKEKLSDSYLDIPNEVENLVFRTIFWENGIYFQSDIKKATYKVKLTNIDNAIHNSISPEIILYKNDLFTFEEISKPNLLRFFSLYEPFRLKGLNINWIGNEYSVQKYILEDDINEVSDYVKNSGLGSKTYLDIQNYYIFYLLYEDFREKGITLEANPQQAEYFLRTFDGTNKTNLYDDMPNQKIVWKNKMFRLVSLSKENRVLGNYEYWYLNFINAFNYVKNNGNTVYLDMPSNEYYYLFFKKFLPEQGIKVVDKPEETKLFLRFGLFDINNTVRLNTIFSRNEKLIWSPQKDNISTRFRWNLELVEIPFESRTVSSTPAIQNYPIKFLTGDPNYDFSISISDFTEKAQYLRILLEPGPSIGFNDFIIRITDKKSFNKTFPVSRFTNIIDIPLNEFVVDSTDKTIRVFFEGLDKLGKKLIGNSLMPLEERYLNYILIGMDLADNKDNYSDFLLAALNHPPLKGKSLMEKLFNSEYSSDINESKAKSLLLGQGWGNAEEFEDKIFRWVGDKPAEIVVNNLDEKLRVVRLDLEPGPGCGGKALDLKIFYKDRLIKEQIIDVRKKISIQLPDEFLTNPNEQKIIKLVPATVNDKISSDPRILNFRVFDISFNETENTQNSVVSEGSIKLLKLGEGWYPYEEYDNEKFHWVGQRPAEININNRYLSDKILNINLETGPGCGDKPLYLDLFFNGKLLKKEKFRGKGNLQIDFSKIPVEQIKDQNIIELISISDNVKTPDDPRILNFRVFNIGFVSNN
jgi:hypothetical protein